MTPHADDLDTTYTALAEALGRVGEEKSALLLATLSLSLLAREPDAARALALIEEAERLANT